MARTANRIGKLVCASARKTQPPPYRSGLQRMWTARRLRTRPAPPHPVLRGVRGLTPGSGKHEIRRIW